LFLLAKLTFIFTPSLAQSLPQLETLEVSSCDELKHTIREQDDEKAIIPEFLRFQKLKTLFISDCDELEYIFPGSLSPSLVNLKQMTIRYCGKLEYVFPVSVAPSLLNLEQMTIFADNLKQIFYSGEEDALPSDGIVKLPQLREMDLSSESDYSFFGPKNLAAPLPFLQNLVHLKLFLLAKLKFIFTPSLAQSLPQLETLEVSCCYELKYIVRKQDGERAIIPEFLSFQKLKTLFISDCDNLEYVFPGSLSPSLVNLKQMTIRYCGKLVYVFPVPVAPSLLNLEQMAIFSDNLKQIFYSGEEDALPRDGIVKLPRLREMAISSKSNYSFFGPKNLAAQLPFLQNLSIDGHKELGNLLAQLQVRPLYFSANCFPFLS
jgi:hypothetical protein